jgi:3-hydroxybutyryl-CoA dehydrogenase
MGSPVLSLACRVAALSLFERAGAVSWIEDSPGFVAQRVLASIVNMACDVAQKGIASPSDIDRSVQIALGYPAGPLSMGDRFGPKRVVQILDGLYAFYGEERYRASPWLRRRAALDVSLLTVSSTANLARAA